MKYDLNRLDPHNFEVLVQGVARKVFGYGTITFGNGPDGGRESEFTGAASYPSDAERWSGYWVIQAKFRSVLKADEAKDFRWVEAQLKSELDKYNSRRIKVKKPNNYILFTNVRLTGVAKLGGRDQITAFERLLEHKYKIEHIRVISYDDIVDFLNNFRDIAIAFAPFVLPGDVLAELLELLGVGKNRKLRIKELVHRFMETEFKEDMQSKLDHAGKLTSDRINLDKVFIDLNVHAGGIQEKENYFKFVKFAIVRGNQIMRGVENPNNRFVLIAGPGYGKSTMTQFIAQIYRAHFLSGGKAGKGANSPAKMFMKEIVGIVDETPTWQRIPFRIVLKDYAGWIRESNAGHPNGACTVLDYLVSTINRRTGGNLTTEELESLFTTLPCVFIFDGLDEVPVSSNRESVITEIGFFVDILLTRIEADYIIISTSRPQGYSKEFDSSQYLHLGIADLSKEECKNYLKRLLENLIDPIKERGDKYKILLSALSHAEISRLMKSPLQASIMAILVKSGGDPPSNKYDLFTDYYQIILKREKQRNISSVLSEKTQYVTDVHWILGYYLQVVSEGENNPSATIEIDKFQQLVMNYLVGKEIEKSEALLISHEIINTATDRLVFISEMQDGKIGFAIRSLQEFFAAHEYIGNVKDNDLKASLFRIAENAYWHNTLLFVIGYLSKVRAYMVDSIESLCYELNGNSESYDESNLSSILKTGSWLALDIVNEGIFRDNPKIENKFCNLLKPLFEIGFCEKHLEFSRLHSSIIDRWVMKYMEEYLQDHANTTAWRLGAKLCTHSSGIAELMERYWPISIEFQMRIMKVFLEEKNYCTLLLNKLMNLLTLNEKAKFVTLLSEMKSRELIESICKYALSTNTSIGVLGEVLFFETINDRYEAPTFMAALNILEGGSGLKSNPRHRMTNWMEQLNIQVVEGTTYAIVKYELIDSKLIRLYLKFARKKKLYLMTKGCQLIEDPCYKNIVAFQKTLSLQDEQYAKIVSERVMYYNSLFASVFNAKGLESEDEIEHQRDQIQMMTAENIQLRADLIAVHYKWAVGRSMTVGDQINKLAELKERYSELLKNNRGQVEMFFMTFYSWVFNHLSQKELNSFKEHANLNDEIAQCLESFGREMSTPQFVHSLFSVEVSELVRIFTDNNQFHDRKFVAKRRLFRDSFNLFAASVIFDKLCKVVTIQLLSGNEPPFKMLAQQLVILDMLQIKIDTTSIPFKVILERKLTDWSSKYVAAVLLLDSNFSETHEKAINEILIANETSTDKQEIVDAILSTMRYAPNNKFVDQCLTRLYRFVDDKAGSQLSEYSSRALVHIGNRSTEIRLGY